MHCATVTVARWTCLLHFLRLLSIGKTESILTGTCTTPTPTDFQTRFIQYCVGKDYMYNEDTCNSAWSKFLGAFANKNPEDVQQENYDEYFDTLPFTVDRDHSLFWSGTRDFAEILSMMERSGLNMMSSHTIDAAKLINEFGFDLCWCSSSGNTGLDDGPCPKSTKVHFWAQFGARLARAASGSVFYLVNGMRMPAYNQGSLFACHELNNFNRETVKQLVVLNIHIQGESCGTSTLAVLCDNTTARGIPCTCYDIEGQVENNTQEQETAVVEKLVAKIGEIQNGVKYHQYSTAVIFLALLVSYL